MQSLQGVYTQVDMWLSGKMNVAVTVTARQNDGLRSCHYECNLAQKPGKLHSFTFPADFHAQRQLYGKCFVYSLHPQEIELSAHMH